MNKLVIASLVAALTGVVGAPKTAHADGDEVAAAIGGFIGGLIIGSNIDRDHGHRGGHVDVDVGFEVSSGRHYHRHGYWEIRTVRVWVPGRWVVSYDRCGNRHRYFERGHHEHRRERVWVGPRDWRRCNDCRGHYDRDDCR